MTDVKQHKNLEIKKLLHNQKIRYIFFGILTTAVNFSMFTLLFSGLGWQADVANLCAISSSILFSYVVSVLFVFEQKDRSVKALSKTFASFVSGRLATMAVEFFGVMFLVAVLHFNEYVAKIAISVIVLILNYIISKFIFERNQTA